MMGLACSGTAWSWEILFKLANLLVISFPKDLLRSIWMMPVTHLSPFPTIEPSGLLSFCVILSLTASSLECGI
jgi:hypothetical protein